MTKYFCDICLIEGNPVAEATIEVDTTAPAKKLKVRIKISYGEQFSVDLCDLCLRNALNNIAADCSSRANSITDSNVPSPQPRPTKIARPRSSSEDF